MLTPTLRKAAKFAAFLLFLSGPCSVALASVNVSPVIVHLSDGHNKDIIRISNGSEQPKSFQVDVVSWSQTKEERESYSPTDDLLVVPPLFTLEAGETQVVRIGLMRGTEMDRELSYRIFFTELAPPQPDSADVTGISMRMRLGVPIFVKPENPALASIDFVQQKTIEGQLYMQLKNTGNVHVKINEVHYQAPTAVDKEVTPTVFYLLPVMTGYLPVTQPNRNTGGTVTLVTDTVGNLEYELAGPQ